jgi:hypothetical protein
VQAFLGRPIEGDWPYLWIDATYVKVREAGRIVPAAVIVAVAVNKTAQQNLPAVRPLADSQARFCRHQQRFSTLRLPLN